MAAAQEQPAASSEQPSTSGKPQPSVERVRSLLYRRVKVALPSGRVIEGDLACLDKQGNLILANAAEHLAGHQQLPPQPQQRGSAQADSQDSSQASSGPPGEPAQPAQQQAQQQQQQQQQHAQKQQQPQQQQTNPMGMVLVPKAQQASVSLQVSLAERAALLSLADEPRAVPAS